MSGVPPAVVKAERLTLPRSVTQVFSTLISFEALFVLFVFAGRFKADPRLAWLPVDATALTAVVSFAVGLLVWLRRGCRVPRNALPLLVLWFALVWWVQCSLVWTLGHDYASSKALSLAILGSWSLLGPALLIAPDPRRMQRFFRMFLLMAVLTALDITVIFITNPGARFIQALGGGYLGAGFALATAVLIIWGHILYTSAGVTTRVLRILIFAWLLGATVVLAGRSPLLGALAGMMLPLYAGLRLRVRSAADLTVRRRVLWALLLILAIGLVTAYASEKSDRLQALQRWRTVFEAPEGGDSTAIRLSYYPLSLQLWGQSPIIGYGIGSWPVLAGFGDVRGFPHNLILETLVELGLVGTILLVAVVFSAWRAMGGWRGARHSPTRMVLAMLLLFHCMMALGHGELAEQRLLFTVLGLMPMLRIPLGLGGALTRLAPSNGEEPRGKGQQRASEVPQPGAGQASQEAPEG